MFVQLLSSKSAPLSQWKGFEPPSNPSLAQIDGLLAENRTQCSVGNKKFISGDISRKQEALIRQTDQRGMAVHLIVARLLSMSVIFCLLPISNILFVTLAVSVFLLFSAQNLAFLKSFSSLPPSPSSVWSHGSRCLLPTMTMLIAILRSATAPRDQPNDIISYKSLHLTCIQQRMKHRSPVWRFLS